MTKTLPVTVTSAQLEQLEQLAELHTLTLQDYLQAIVQREILMMGTLEERHPHIFRPARIIA